jgi:hypothetical protein
LNGLSLQRASSPSRCVDVSDQSDLPKDIKGPLGFNPLNTTSEPLIDFIFVHGLGGGSRKTWSKTSSPNHYWPKEWLPREPAFKNVRIHSFGYNADWAERKDSILDIHDFAGSLLGDMMNNPDIKRDNVGGGKAR